MADKAGPGEAINVEGTLSAVKGLRYICSLNSYDNVYCTFYNTIKDTAWDQNATAMGAGATVTHANAADNATPADTDTILLGRLANIKDGFIQSFDDR
jgi:hypothetical protein